MIQSTKISTSLLVSSRVVPWATGLAIASAALLMSGCGETPKTGSGSTGSAPASTSAPAPMDAASAPKQ